jgi:hypothetical protein
MSSYTMRTERQERQERRHNSVYHSWWSNTYQEGERSDTIVWDAANEDFLTKRKKNAISHLQNGHLKKEIQKKMTISLVSDLKTIINVP